MTSAAHRRTHRDRVADAITRGCTYLVDLDTDEPCGRRAVITVQDTLGHRYDLCRRHEKGGRRRAEDEGYVIEELS